MLFRGDKSVTLARCPDVAVLSPENLHSRFSKVLPVKLEKKRANRMAFILGVILFVLVVGWIDAGLPWPDPRNRDGLR